MISFKFVLHVPLYEVVNNYFSLIEEEKRFTSNTWSHVDFLIFNKLDKSPVLVIEVDGFQFHKKIKNNQKEIQLKIAF